MTWMSGGVLDNDRDEARSARHAADRDNDPHPDTCRCRPCLVDRFDPADERGSATTAGLLLALTFGGLLAAFVIGQDRQCRALLDTGSPHAARHCPTTDLQENS